MNYPTIRLGLRSDEITQAILNNMPVQPQQTALETGINTFSVAFDTVTDYTYAMTELNKLALSELCYIYLRHDRVFGETLVVESANTRKGLATVSVMPIISKNVPVAAVDYSGFLLMETGDNLLLETGDKIILDDTEGFTAYDDFLNTETSYGDNVINDIRFRFTPREVMYYSSAVDACWTFHLSSNGSNAIFEDFIEANATKKVISPYGFFNNAAPSGATSITFFKLAGSGRVCLVAHPFPTGFQTALLFDDADASTASLLGSFTVDSFAAYADRVEFTITNPFGVRGYMSQDEIVILPGSARIIRDPDTQAPAVQDATSISENDYKSLQFDQLYQVNATAGNAFAEEILTAEKNPRTVLNAINYNANRNSRAMMAFLNLDIGDYFPATDTNKGIDGKYYVQNFGFTVDPGGFINYRIGVKQDTLPPTLGSVVTGTSSGGTSISLTHPLSVGPDMALIVSVTLRGSESISSIAKGAQSFTLKSSKSFGSGVTDPRVELWYLLDPDLLSTSAIVITSSAATFMQAASMDFTRVSQSAPFGTVVDSSGTGTSASVTPTGAVSDLMIDVIGVATGTVTPDSTQDSRWNATSDSFWRGAGSTEPGATSVPMSWTLGGSNKWALLAVAIKKA